MAVWLLLHAWMGHRYASAWVSDVALWRWAAAAAPASYRPMTNYHKAIVTP